MSKLSSFSISVSTARANASLTSLLSYENLCFFMSEFGPEQRHRKFDRAAFFICAVGMLAGRAGPEKLMLASVARSYRSMTGSDISSKCLWNRLALEGSAYAARLLAAAALTAAAGESLSETVLQKHGSAAAMCLSLGVDDVIFFDGTEFRVPLRSLKNFDCKGKGRKKKDGSRGSAGLKVHIGFSVKKGCAAWLSVTGACVSERGQLEASGWIKPKDGGADGDGEKPRGPVLFVADRGYSGLETEREITEAGHSFLIRCRDRPAAKIASFNGDEYAEAASELKNGGIGCPARDLLRFRRSFDVNVRNEDGSVTRLLICHSPIPKEARGETEFMIFRTSLTPCVLPLKAAVPLYRLRWCIEIFNKCMKSGNGLAAVNSGNLEILLQFVMFSVIACALKTWAGKRARIRLSQDKEISVLILHTGLCGEFEQLCRDLYTCSRTTLWRKLSRLEERIASECTKAPLSSTNRDLRKDRDLLMNDVTEACQKGQLFVKEPKAA